MKPRFLVTRRTDSELPTAVHWSKKERRFCYALDHTPPTLFPDRNAAKRAIYAAMKTRRRVLDSLDRLNGRAPGCRRSAPTYSIRLVKFAE